MGAQKGPEQQRQRNEEQTGDEEENGAGKDHEGDETAGEPVLAVKVVKSVAHRFTVMYSLWL